MSFGSTAGVFIMLFGLLFAAVWWLGPDLARDWRIRGDAAAAGTAVLEQAQCRSRLSVLTVCDITYTDAGSSATPHRTMWYFFIGRRGEEPIALVRSRSDPGAVSTNIGLATFYSRLLVFALILALLIGCIVLTYKVTEQAIDTQRALARLTGQRLRPIVVRVEGKIYIGHKRRRWTYVYDAGGREERAHVELARTNDPLFVTPDGKNALAVTGPAGGIPLLLDMHLSALDLTQAEKEAFFARCRALLGVDGTP
jgi:hypothetical protein